jgi:hypothetical protein
LCPQVDTRIPQRGLADPGFALHDQNASAASVLVEPSLDGRKFVVTADHRRTDPPCVQ